MKTSPAARHEITAISCGRDHTLALLATGKAFGWGGDGSGRVPPDTPQYCSTSTAPTTAVEVVLRERVTAIAAGYGVSLAVTDGGRVAVWGATAAGIGGRVRAVAPATPQLLAGITGARCVVAAEFQFAAIDDGGTIHTWGLNHEGALGRPTAQLNALPGPVQGVPPARQVVTGKGYMLALSRDGKLYAWGDNAAGQLGLGHLQAVAVPALLRVPATVVRVLAAGATHALALTGDGEVLAWGSNHHGQLGSEGLRYSAVPVPVRLPQRVRAVAAGMHFSLALGERGNVYAWGWNGHGQLGVDDTADRHTPVRVPGLAKVDSVAAGQTHAVALTPTGLRGWGNNAGGQIGALVRRQLQPAEFFAVA